MFSNRCSKTFMNFGACLGSLVSAQSENDLERKIEIGF